MAENFNTVTVLLMYSLSIEQLGLTSPDYYYYLNQSGLYVVDGIDDVQEYHDTRVEKLFILVSIIVIVVLITFCFLNRLQWMLLELVLMSKRRFSALWLEFCILATSHLLKAATMLFQLMMNVGDEASAITVFVPKYIIGIS